MTRKRRGVHPARTDTPPANVVLGVWYEPEQREIDARWTGTRWETPDGVAITVAITHWYPK